MELHATSCPFLSRKKNHTACGGEKKKKQNKDKALLMFLSCVQILVKGIYFSVIWINLLVQVVIIKFDASFRVLTSNMGLTFLQNFNQLNKSRLKIEKAPQLNKSTHLIQNLWTTSTRRQWKSSASLQFCLVLKDKEILQPKFYLGLYINCIPRDCIL